MAVQTRNKHYEYSLNLACLLGELLPALVGRIADDNKLQLKTSRVVRDIGVIAAYDSLLFESVDPVPDSTGRNVYDVSHLFSRDPSCIALQQVQDPPIYLVQFKSHRYQNQAGPSHQRYALLRIKYKVFVTTRE